MDSLRVACVADSGLLASRLRDAIQRPGAVRAFAGADDALLAIARGEIQCTVLAVDAATFDRDLGTVRRIREGFSAHPIVVWCEMRGLSSRQLLDVAALNVTDLAFRGVTDSRHSLARLLASARQHAGARQLNEQLSVLLPRQVRPLFLMALDRASEPLDVRRAAAAFGVTRQTLRNRLAQYGLPRPQAFLLWCRLLVAGRLLDERGRTLDSVADQLQFSSGQNLGATLRRYVGATISTLREGEVGPTIEAEFRRVVARGTGAHEADTGGALQNQLASGR